MHGTVYVIYATIAQSAGAICERTDQENHPAAMPPRRLNHATPTCVSLSLTLCMCEMETRDETQRAPLADLNEREARLARRLRSATIDPENNEADDNAYYQHRR